MAHWLRPASQGHANVLFIYWRSLLQTLVRLNLVLMSMLYFNQKDKFLVTVI